MFTVWYGISCSLLVIITQSCCALVCYYHQKAHSIPYYTVNTWNSVVNHSVLYKLFYLHKFHDEHLVSKSSSRYEAKMIYSNYECVYIHWTSECHWDTQLLLLISTTKYHSDCTFHTIRAMMTCISTLRWTQEAHNLSLNESPRFLLPGIVGWLWVLY